MKVLPEELTVHLRSYGRMAEDRDEAARTTVFHGKAGERAGPTRVNPEQASKRLMRVPTRLPNGEGRRARIFQPSQAGRLAGVMGRAREHRARTQHGRPTPERRSLLRTS